MSCSANSHKFELYSAEAGLHAHFNFFFSVLVLFVIDWSCAEEEMPPLTSAAIPPTSVDFPIIAGRRETQNEETDPDEAFEEAGGKINVEEVEDFKIEINSLAAYYDDRNSARPCLGNIMEVTSEDGVN